MVGQEVYLIHWSSGNAKQQQQQQRGPAPGEGGRGGGRGRRTGEREGEHGRRVEAPGVWWDGTHHGPAGWGTAIPPRGSRMTSQAH